MKKKKTGKWIRKAGLVAGLAATFAGISMCAPSVVTFAEENVTSAESDKLKEIEELKAKKEAAQAAYDAALRDKLLAEDELENARRAVSDAEAEYEDVWERYSTGFAGFLRWVIETEEDSVKVEDAKQVLAATFAEGSTVSADDSANITRMLYMADWLEDIATYFRNTYDVEADTSHAAMRLSQIGMDEVVKYEYEKAYDVVEEESARISATVNSGKFRGMWNSFTGIPPEQQDEMPVISKFEKDKWGWIPYFTWVFDKRSGYKEGDITRVVYEDGTELYYRGDGSDLLNSNGPFMYLLNEEWEMINDEWMTDDYLLSDWYQDLVRDVRAFRDKIPTDIPANKVFYHNSSFGDVDYSLMFYELNNLLQSYNIENGITIGEAVGVNPELGNVVTGAVFGGKGTYTIDEYVSAIREYCAMTDPLAARSVLAQRNDDFDNASRQLAGAEETLLAAGGRLKGAEKEYEEAVTGLAGLVSAEEAEDVVQIASANEVYAAENISVEEGTESVTVRYSAESPAIESVTSSNVNLSAESPVTESVTALSGQSPAWSGNTVFDASVNETYSPESLLAAENMTSANDAVTSQEAHPEQMSIKPEASTSETFAQPEIQPVKAADEIKTEEGLLQTATDTTSAAESEEQKPHILAEVLSYIFNGGAIAIIITTGLWRKKRTGDILHGEV